MVKKKSKKEEKKEIEELLNELLGVDIKWSQLSYENLKELTFIFSNPDILAKKLDIESKYPVLDMLKQRFNDLLTHSYLADEIRKRFSHMEENNFK